MNSQKNESDSSEPLRRALTLAQLFCSAEEFGVVRSVSPDEVPEPARTLLDHRSHMTVAMERFHGGDVRLRVVARLEDAWKQCSNDGIYAREILLETQTGQCVQFGIVRIDLTHLDPATADAIRGARRPLGRILIDAGMLREVHAVKLLQIVPGPHLRDLLWGGSCQPGDMADASPLYGRVAEIQLDGRPTVELLEIVAPTGAVQRDGSDRSDRAQE